jgi:GH25 family lysozyme M1 (1,4-beta-N-acetylmuramidase)
LEIKVVDVSAWNGNVDYNTVKQVGITAGIIRITERYNKTDSYFEKNYAGMLNTGLKIGVYKFSYALNISEIQKEADAIIKVLNGRKLDFPVFLDLEWQNQRALSKEILTNMVKAFERIITSHGYKFGIYCNVDWYSNVLDVSRLPYDYWLAAYPQNDTGIIVERLRPQFGIAWQYSSKYKINGKNFDVSVFYKDYSNDETKGGTTMATAQDAKNKVISIAKAELGYLEKKSNEQLDDKTANSGYNNYTKYWRDIKPGYQTEPWCAAFVSWVLMKAFGQSAATKLLKHWPYVYCPDLAARFTKYANPEVGDIVIFYRNGTFAHTGIVTKVSGDYFETVEGNTSSGSTIVPNGGGVYAKAYYNSNLPGTKFCRIDWQYAASVMQPITKPWLQIGDSGENVRELQAMLNKIGFNCGNADGDFGQNTENAVKRFQTAYNLAVDGQYGKDSKAVLDSAYEAITTAYAMTSDSKGLCIANLSLIGRVSPNGVHIKKYPKGTWLHPYLKKKDTTGRWWFACKMDGLTQWFSSTGFNGWVKDTVGWWYLLKGYKYYASEWRRIRGLWYEFDANGYIKCSQWSTYKGRKRYLKADGSMAHDEVLAIDGKKYQFEEGGGMIEL